MSSLDEFLAATEADIAEIERLRAEMKGPCTECKYREYQSYYQPDLCTCPVITGLYLDPTDGKVEPKKQVSCEKARKPRGACGPEGRCFVQKPPPPPEPMPEPKVSWWRRIFEGQNT